MTFFYDLNKRLDGIRATPETTHGQLNERDEGKPGKNFAKIAKDAGERYGSKAAGERVAGAVRNKLRAQGKLEETEMDESAFQAAIGKKKYGDEGMKALQKAGRDHASDTTMDKIRDKYDKYDEGVYQGSPDKSKIPAYQRPNDPLTLQDLEKERTQSPTSPEGMRALQDKLRDIHPLDEVGNTPMTSKQKSFAALAEPKDKITFADKIAGAKKEVDEMLGDVAAEAMKKAVGQHKDMDMEEGNDFTGARLAAIRAGKPSFKVGGKSYRVSGDTSQERGMAEARHSDDEDDVYAYQDDTKKKTHKTASGGTVTRHGGVTRHQAAPGHYGGYDPETDPDKDDDKSDKPAGEKRGRGRPKGPAKGPERVTAKAYKHKGQRKMSKEEIEEAISVLEQCGYTVSMTEDNDGPAEMNPAAVARFNEPNKKFYTKNPHFMRGTEVKSVGKTVDASGKPISALATKVTPKNKPAPVTKKSATPFEQEELEEKAVSKQQQKFMGMVHAMQKGEKVKGASPELKKVAKTMKKSDAEDFAATKHKGLPKKKDEAVEENTVSGAVATAPAGGASKSKGGMQFGKGVYEGAIAESFNAKLDSMLAEGMNMNMSTDSEGHKSLSVTATDEDAVSLAEILKMAGLGGNSDGYKEACPACGSSDCGCDHIEEDQDLANSADNTMYSDTDTMVNKLSGGLNGQKTTGQTTVPVIASQNRQTSDFREFNGQVAEATESRLWNLFKKY
jgi:hypothetical protein